MTSPSAHNPPRICVACPLPVVVATWAGGTGRAPDYAGLKGAVHGHINGRWAIGIPPGNEDIRRPTAIPKALLQITRVSGIPDQVRQGLL